MAVPARGTTFSGRRWPAGSGSSPGNGLFGPEVAGGWRFRPGKRPFRAGGGRGLAVQARGMAFSGRRWPAGSTLWAGPLLGVSFQAPLTAKSAYFVVRGAARDTPNDGRKKGWPIWCCHKWYCLGKSEGLCSGIHGRENRGGYLFENEHFLKCSDAITRRAITQNTENHRFIRHAFP